MTETKAFILANRELLPVIEQITDDQWSLPVPAQMTWQPNQTLRDIVNYHTYDDAWVPDTLAGKTAAEVGSHYDFLRTTTDTVAEYKKYNARATDAVKNFHDLDRTTHLSYGDFPARDYLQHITLFRGLRTYDIAQVIGHPVTLSDDLVQALWDIIKPHEQALRDMHVIGERLEVADDAPLHDQLLAMTGRQPS